jgi:hypothetical protein
MLRVHRLSLVNLRFNPERKIQMAKLSGGGIQGNKVVNKPVRYGDPGGARIVSPSGVSQIGGAQGAVRRGSNITSQNSAVPVMKGPVGGGINVKLGNQVAAETVCGVGGSRTVSKSGSQSHHQSSPMSKGKDILSGYGPEKSKG